MIVSKRHVLKHGNKQKKPYVRDVKIGCTGVDITYSEKKLALQFVTRNIAILVARSLETYGNFYAESVDDGKDMETNGTM